MPYRERLRRRAAANAESTSTSATARTTTTTTSNAPRMKLTVEKGRGGSRENKKKIAAAASSEVFFLSGTLSYSLSQQQLPNHQRRHVIEGDWWEKEYPQIKQRFVLARTSIIHSNRKDFEEDSPDDGEFEGSYNYENECFPERVKLFFKHLEGKSKGKFIVNGTGTNEFGNFELFGTATKSTTDGSMYEISLRKWYSNSDSDLPPAPSKASKAATTPLTTLLTTPAVWEKGKLKDNKRRKNTTFADDEKAGKIPKKSKTRSEHMDKKQTTTKSTRSEANMAESGAAKGGFRKYDKPSEVIATSPTKLGTRCVGQLEAKYAPTEGQPTVADNQDTQAQNGQKGCVKRKDSNQSSFEKERAAKNHKNNNKEGKDDATTFANTTAQSISIRSSSSQGPDNKLMNQVTNDWMFIKVLMKYLQQRDTEMHTKAKIAIEELNEKRKSAGPNVPISLMDAFKSRLRSLVGGHYWKKAQYYHEYVLKQKRLQKQQQLSQQQGHSQPMEKQVEDVEVQTNEAAKNSEKCPIRPITPKSAGDDVTIMTESGAAKSSVGNEAKCDKPSEAIAISPVKLGTGTVDSQPSSKSRGNEAARAVVVGMNGATDAKCEARSAYEEKTLPRAHCQHKAKHTREEAQPPVTDNQDPQARSKQKDNINDADSKQKATQANLRQDAPVDEEENSGEALPLPLEKRPPRAYCQQKAKHRRGEAQTPVADSQDMEAKNEQKDNINDADSRHKVMPANRGQDAPVDEEESRVLRGSRAATNSVAIKSEDTDDDDSIGNCHFQLVLSSKVTDFIIKVPRRRNISFQRLRSEIDEEGLMGFFGDEGDLEGRPYKFTLHAGGATRLGPKQEQNWKKWNIWEYLTKQGDGSCLNPYHVFIEEE